MPRSYYASTISTFIAQSDTEILRELLDNDEFKTEDTQKSAWKHEISILKEQLARYSDGSIIFEYTIPRIGKRIDIVLILRGIIFLIEFKDNSDDNRKSTQDQVMDYALDLKYFHQESQNRILIPISCETESEDIPNKVLLMSDSIAKVMLCNKNNICNAIASVLSQYNDKPINHEEWINSRYSPTPTIIEAAKAMYRNHTVEDISKHEADGQNLGATTDSINKIIDSCKQNHRKAICFITGVPGAGKTLAGLNIANSRHKFSDDEHAVFLSGNDPLVDVLQAALATDKAERDNITKKDAMREAISFIQIIHKFRDNALSDLRPPFEKVAIFDEAQRAWDKEELSDFMKRKKGIPGFNMSEPEFLIEIMDRHKDWSVIICLVGGGQEIYKGEAGIVNWFEVLSRRFFDWDIYASSRMHDSEYIGNKSIEELLKGRSYFMEDSLHLGVPLRSFRSERLATFVKNLLDVNIDSAIENYKALKDRYPIYITRSLITAKEWVKKQARGTERYGLLASSEAKRLRAEGIWVLSKINHVGWFLNDKDNVDSSYYLEVAASEYKVQGLEVDYALLAWDADFRFENNSFTYHKFRGDSWNNVKQERDRRYMKNAYRVLLTRARQGLIIFIPNGSDKDKSRKKEYYDGTYQYLKSLGIEELL